MGGIVGFAQDMTAMGHRGIGAQDHARRQSESSQAAQGRLQLESGDPLHVVSGRFTRQEGFQRFGVFVGLWRHEHR
jgi:hypothetical protein